MTPGQWSRVKELFELALGSSPPGTACLHLHLEDEEVAEEVERLVWEYFDAGSFLQSAPSELPRPAFGIGDLIAGRYRVTDRLGQGGMGEVYRAEDRELGGVVALKTILPEYLANETALSRFKREIAVARKVTHPNVCRVFDLEVHEDEATGKCAAFLTMEFLAGETLSAHLKKSGPFRRDEALPLICQMAEGIHAAHRAGVIHRDLKSGNVMLMPSVGGSPRAVITDFGLAREINVPTETVTLLTAPRHIIGTPAYMAPELFLGAQPSIASDIYAFGLVQFEMATGRRPDSPSQSPRDLVHDLDPVWAASIMRCLQRDPAQRFASTLDAASALQPAVQPAPTKPLNRPFAVVSLLALFIVGLLVIAESNQLRAILTGVPEAKHIAVLPFAAIGAGDENQAFADGLTETVTSKLSSLEQYQKALWVVPGSEVRSRKLTSVEETRKAFGVTLVITGNVQAHGDAITVTANLVDARNLKQLQSRAIELSTKSAGSMQNSVVGEVAGMLGLRVSSQARRTLSAGQAGSPEAYRLYEEGLGYLRRFGPENVQHAIVLFQDAVARDPKFALGYTHLGEAYLLNYQFSKNSADVDLANSNVNRALNLDAELGTAHATLAGVKASTGHLPEAIQEFKRALQIDPGDGVALVGLARAYSDSGRFKEAELTFQQAIQMRPDYWLGYSSLGAFYFEQSQYSNAEKMFKEVVQLIPDNVLGYLNLGAVYLQMARYSEAEGVLRKAVALKPNAKAYSNLSVCYSFQNQPRHAVEMLEKAVALDPNNDMNWGNLGDAYRQIPELERRAPEAYRRALGAVMHRLVLKPDSTDLLMSMALYSAKLKDFSAALKALEKGSASGHLNSIQIFKAAKIWELIGKRDRALMSLSEAIQRGYSREQVLKEPELARLREDHRFKAILDDSKPVENQSH